MIYHPEDLSPLEVTLLGVLCVGLPPAREARDDSFRVDHVAAVVSGLREGRPGVHLAADGTRVLPEFATELRAAIERLVSIGLLARAPAGMPAPPGSYEVGLELDMVNPDEHPAVLDRYLAQQCMEVLFREPAVYPFLMERYTRSGEVWRRLREAGYAR